jgi:hypothetical protein
MKSDKAVTPRPTTRLTMTQEIRTPRAIESIDLRRLMPNTQAASVPVQAPVTGRGMATKSRSKKNKAEASANDTSPLTDREKQMMKEMQELRESNQILKDALYFFAKDRKK